jgi:hypothetical protein
MAYTPAPFSEVAVVFWIVFAISLAIGLLAERQNRKR